MSDRADALRPLRMPAMVLAGVLAAAALLVYATGRFASAMEDSHSNLQRELTDVSIRLQRLRGQAASFRSDAEAWQRLSTHGLQGPEPRLAWVELMRTLPSELGVERADFQLAAQRPFAHLPAESGPPLELSATSVTLQLVAAHESRVLNFLAELQTRTPGLLVLRSCELAAEDGPVRANCRLDWITLDPAS